MAEDNPENKAEIKTTNDIDIASLTKRLDDLEKVNADLRSDLKDALEANKGLFARLSTEAPKKEEPITQAQPTAQAGDPAVDLFKDKLGIKEL